VTRLLLGIDAGNSKTWAMAGDMSGRFLGWGKGPRGNHQAREVGVAGAVEAFATAVEGALAQAGARIEEVARASFCLAGADLPSDYELLGSAIHVHWPSLSFSVHNDSIAGLRSGTSRGWGAVVVCGTGTNAVGRGRDGREVQVGGLGYLDGDYGGGGDLGRDAVRASFQAAFGRGRETALLPMVLAALGQPSADAFRDAIYQEALRPGYVLDLAPLVFNAANEGDEVAQELLIHMGTELGKAGGAALKAVELDQADGAEVVLSGSVWKGKSPLLIDAFRLSLHRTAPRAAHVRPRYEPVVGAYLLALEFAAGQVGPSEVANLEASLPDSLRIRSEEV